MTREKEKIRNSKPQEVNTGRTNSDDNTNGNKQTNKNKLNKIQEVTDTDTTDSKP